MSIITELQKGQSLYFGTLERLLPLYFPEEDLDIARIELQSFISDLRSKADLIALSEGGHGEHWLILALIEEEISNFDGILVEIPVDFQPHVEYYLQTGEFGDSFEQWIQGAASEGKDLRNMMKVTLDLARSNELPVICIDSSKTENREYANPTSDGYYYCRGDNRDEDMKDNINGSINPGEKWILIGGGFHLEHEVNPVTGDVSLGKRLKDEMQDLFQCIAMRQIQDTDSIEWIVKCHVGGHNSLSPDLQRWVASDQRQIANDMSIQLPDLNVDGYIFHLREDVQG